MPNLVESGQIVAKMWRFFQDGGRPPSWICCVGDWTTNEGLLVVFITVKNLVGIDAVVSVLCKFLYFASLALKHLFMPLFGGFWGTFPQIM